jgi:hypothetical protein
VWRQQFSQLLRTWEASNGDPDDLLTGTNLSEASKWAAARASELTKQELSFIEAGRKADEQVRQEAAQTLASPAVQRRVRNADWEEKQRLENRVRELETLSRGSMLRRLSAATVGIVHFDHCRLLVLGPPLQDKCARSGTVDRLIATKPPQATPTRWLL